MKEPKYYPDLSREELYALVWTKPMVQLAKDFDLSDQGLRKICVRKQIPLPKAGYWAKLAAGQSPPRPPLLDFSDVQQKASRTAAQTLRKKQQDLESAGWRPPTAADGDMELPWHPAIAPLRKEALESAKKADRQKSVFLWEAAHPGKEHPDRRRLGLWGWQSRSDRGEPVIETHSKHALRVSLSNYERALRLLNAIAHRAAADGLTVSLTERHERIKIARDSLAVDLRLAEKFDAGYRQEYRSWSKTFERVKVLKPTGRFAIHVAAGGGGETAVTDRVGTYLETRLDEVMKLIAAKLSATAKWKQELDEWHRQHEEEERQREELKRQQAAERARQAHEDALNAAVVKEAESWDSANSLHRYLEALDACLAAGGIPADGYQEWRIRAEAVVDALDPSNLRVKVRD